MTFASGWSGMKVRCDWCEELFDRAESGNLPEGWVEIMRTPAAGKLLCCPTCSGHAVPKEFLDEPA